MDAPNLSSVVHDRLHELWQKRWVKTGAIVAGLVILAVIAIPFFVNADTFRPAVQDEISSALGRRVTMTHLGFSLLSGSLVADNVAIADDPAYSAEPFVEAKSLHIGVNTMELLFNRKLEITNFTADSPRIHLISNGSGGWNYASLGHGATGSGSRPSSASNFSIGELKIENGSVDVRSEKTAEAPFVYNHVNLTVKHLSYTTPMPFELTADVPAGGSVRLTGTAGPIGQPDVMNTPLHASLQVKHFDPVAAGVVPASDGLSAVADLDAQLTSDGKTLNMTGRLEASQLKLSANGSPAPHPVDVDVTTTGNIGARSGRISDLALHTGAVAAHLNGAYRLDGENVVLDLHLSAPGLPIDGIEELLPAMGIKLPSGSSLHGGTLTANLAITGPASAPTISGPVEIDNTHLAGFALGSKIQGLGSSGNSGSGNGTDIRSLRADVTSTPQSTNLEQIDCDVPAIGTATGSGTVSAAGNLNFQLLAKIGGAGTNSAASFAGSLIKVAAPTGVPLTVTGTTANPSIRANLGSMLKEQAGSAFKNNGNVKSGVVGLTKGLIRKW